MTTSLVGKPRRGAAAPVGVHSSECGRKPELASPRPIGFNAIDVLKPGHRPWMGQNWIVRDAGRARNRQPLENGRRD
jgi:hypothetical protein